MKSREIFNPYQSFSLRERLKLDSDKLTGTIETRASEGKLWRVSKKGWKRLTQEGKRLAQDLYGEIMGEEVWPLKLAEFRLVVKGCLERAESSEVRLVARSLLGKIDFQTRKMIWERNLPGFQKGHWDEGGFETALEICRATKGIKIREINFGDWDREYWLGYRQEKLTLAERLESRLEKETLKLEQKVADKVRGLGKDLRTGREAFREGLNQLKPKVVRRALPATMMVVGVVFGLRDYDRPVASEKMVLFSRSESLMLADKGKKGSLEIKPGQAVTLTGSALEGNCYELKTVLPDSRAEFGAGEMIVAGYPFADQRPSAWAVHSGVIGREEPEPRVLPGEIALKACKGSVMGIRAVGKETEMALVDKFFVSEELDLDVEKVSLEAEKRGLNLADGRKYLFLITCSNWNKNLRKYQQRAVLIFASCA